MKILFIIGDLWENSVDRQLAEIVQEFLDGEAETQILESFDITDSTIKSLTEADAIWFIIHEQNDSYPSVISDLFEKTAYAFKNKYCALASIGGNDGGEKALKKLYEKIVMLNMNVMDAEVTCVPLKTERFECPKDYQMDLYWQKESFLQFCQVNNYAYDREHAIRTVCNNYFRLIKFISKDNRKPLKIKIDYPTIITDIGIFEFYDLPEELKELHYEIDALTADYNIKNEEIESSLKDMIDKQW